mmetsp:Transcript_40978/g.98991  ORF Transcript_40978/g.98991 Transcript_40978/m.98991 type:complete len:403 (-) Transcript_40978:34-1242(-)
MGSSAFVTRGVTAVLCLVVAVDVVLKNYGVHEEVVLEGAGRGGQGGRMTELHPAWNFPEANPRLDREAKVHTGEEAIRWSDVGVKVGDPNLAMPVRAGRDPAPIDGGKAATAKPVSEYGKLDKLGVNTGNQHINWDDGEGTTTNMEDSYSFGSTPVREDNSPLAYVGMLDLAQKGSDVVPHRSGVAAGTPEGAHSFFRQHVAPLVGDNARGAGAATGLVREADEAKRKAEQAARRFAKKEEEAEKAEADAARVRRLAEGVGSARLDEEVSERRERAAMRAFKQGLGADMKRLDALGVKDTNHAKAPPASKQAALDRAVQGDRAENKRLSTSADVSDVLGTINSLPVPSKGGTTTAGHRQSRHPRRPQSAAQMGASSGADGKRGATGRRGRHQSWECAFGVLC